MNNKIIFTEIGKFLIGNNQFAEQIVFTNIFCKYQRNNPFRNVDNQNKPLILLLKTIKLLNSDKKYNNVGISRKELPLLICWQNDDANLLYLKIKDIRDNFGYTPSNEIILDECYKLLNLTKRNDKSILVDYVDEFIRKMKLTGLITIRGFGKFININKNHTSLIEYILQQYSSLKNYNSIDEYINYVGSIDLTIENYFENQSNIVYVNNTFLLKWVEYYSWNILKMELNNLSKNKKTEDDILKFIDAPLRLEFLVSIAILKRIKNIQVIANYTVDDEGLPVSFASGNSVDIECKKQEQYILVEVTLLTGNQQCIREIPSITRHLDNYLDKNYAVFSLFISPKISIDSWRMGTTP